MTVCFTIILNFVTEHLSLFTSVMWSILDHKMEKVCTKLLHVLNRTVGGRVCIINEHRSLVYILEWVEVGGVLMGFI